MVGYALRLATSFNIDHENFAANDESDLLAIGRQSELGRLARQRQPLQPVLWLIAGCKNCQPFRFAAFRWDNPEGKVVFVDDKPTITAQVGIQNPVRMIRHLLNFCLPCPLSLVPCPA